MKKTTTKLKGKHKRGERGSIEEDEQNPKRANMDAEGEEEIEFEEDEEDPSSATIAEETSNSELKEILVDIQITISGILRENKRLANEMAELRNSIQLQKTELSAVKSTLDKTMKRFKGMESELTAARRLIDEQEEEISELYDLQDNLEQYTRKNSLEIHGVPESACASTEEVVLKLAEAIDVTIHQDDIEISHRIHRKGIKPILVKFPNHKVKSKLYKARTKLKNVRVSDLFPNSSAATRVESERIYLNENLTSHRRELLRQANEKRKDGMLSSVWTMDGKIFVKTYPEGRPIRIHDANDLEDL